MALTSSGKDIALLRNEQTGKFGFDWAGSGTNKGNPNFDDTRAHSVLLILYSHKRDPSHGTGGYYWDRTGRRGTFLYKAKEDRLATGGLLQGYAEEGGQQLIGDALIQSFQATAKRLRPGRWSLFVKWSVPSGHYQQALSF